MKFATATGSERAIMHNLDPAQVQVFPVRGAYANLIGSVAQLSTGAVKSIRVPDRQRASDRSGRPWIPWAQAEPQIPIGADVRQTANFEASGRPRPSPRGSGRLGEGSETNASYKTGEQRSLSVMPPKYESLASGPHASESLTLADLSPKHAHCAVLHTASRPPAAASGAVSLS